MHDLLISAINLERKTFCEEGENLRESGGGGGGIRTSEEGKLAAGKKQMGTEQAYLLICV